MFEKCLISFGCIYDLASFCIKSWYYISFIYLFLFSSFVYNYRVGYTF